MEITETTALLRLGVSLVLGAAIGLEREYHRHPAGLRTFTLITVSSTMAMLVSIYICEQHPHLLNGDPGRIAAQVLTGIGFIGAGLILKHADGVTGLTTAACIFSAACIGLAAGAGMILTSVVLTCVVVVILLSSSFIHARHRRQPPKDPKAPQDTPGFDDRA